MALWVDLCCIKILTIFIECLCSEYAIINNRLNGSLGMRYVIALPEV